MTSISQPPGADPGRSNAKASTRDHSRPGEGELEAVPLLPRRRPRKAGATRPVPATRQAADELFRPRSPWREATGARLERLNALGLLELRPAPAEPITQQAAHEATLDAMYGPEPHGQGDAPAAVEREREREGDEERPGP